jgi:hypothetical protein
MKIVVFAAPASGTSPSAAMFSVAVRRWQKEIARLFDTYRPERHYMRGPGPKWRAKHGLSEQARG